MILFGAGCSVPFGIPDMRTFVDMFKESLKKDEKAHKLSELAERIESALTDGKTIGNKNTVRLGVLDGRSSRSCRNRG